jgi:hypothetical protein
MAGASNLSERYLQALVQLHDPQAHDARGFLNSLELHTGLIAETLKREDAGDPSWIEKLRMYAATARKAYNQVLEATEALLTQTDLKARPTADLAGMLRALGALIAPRIKEKDLVWRLTVPEVPVPLDIDRVAFWQAMVVAAVEGSETMEPKEIFEITLDVTGRWTMSGPRQTEWLEPLRQTIAAHGGEFLATPKRIEFRMPTGVRR